MHNISCINCSYSFENSEKAFYCPDCLTQVKCKNCNELLINGAKGCVACGTIIEKSQINSEGSLNEIEFEQKGDIKKFKAKFTDTVGHDLVATFGGMVGSSVPKKKSLLNSINKFSSQTIDNEGIQGAEILEEDLSALLLRVFTHDDDKLIFQINDFKSKGKLEKEIRISILFLLGYKHLYNSTDVKRSLLTEALKRFKLNTGSFRSWIGGSSEIGKKSGGLIFLTPDGVEKSYQILKEVLNADISEGSISFSKLSGSRNKKNSTAEKIDNGSARSSKNPKEYIEKLIGLNFFQENKRTLSDIVKELKDNHAVSYKTSDISGHMSSLINKGTLKREKTKRGYEYFTE